MGTKRIAVVDGNIQALTYTHPSTNRSHPPIHLVQQYRHVTSPPIHPRTGTSDRFCRHLRRCRVRSRRSLARALSEHPHHSPALYPCDWRKPTASCAPSSAVASRRAQAVAARGVRLRSVFTPTSPYPPGKAAPKHLWVAVPQHHTSPSRMSYSGIRATAYYRRPTLGIQLVTIQHVTRALTQSDAGASSQHNSSVRAFA